MQTRLPTSNRPSVALMCACVPQGDLLFEAFNEKGNGGPPIFLGLVAHGALVFTIFATIYYCRCIVYLWCVLPPPPPLPTPTSLPLRCSSQHGLWLSARASSADVTPRCGHHVSRMNQLSEREAKKAK